MPKAFSSANSKSRPRRLATRRRRVRRHDQTRNQRHASAGVDRRNTPRSDDSPTRLRVPIEPPVRGARKYSRSHGRRRAFVAFRPRGSRRAGARCRSEGGRLQNRRLARAAGRARMPSSSRTICAKSSTIVTLVGRRRAALSGPKHFVRYSHSSRDAGLRRSHRAPETDRVMP